MPCCLPIRPNECCENVEASLVLVVDEEQSTEILSPVLPHNDYDVLMTDSEEALQRLEQQLLSSILLHVHIPA